MSPSDYTNISLAVATQMIMRAFGTVVIMNGEMLDEYVNRLMDKILDLKSFVTSTTFQREFVAPSGMDHGCECEENK